MKLDFPKVECTYHEEPGLEFGSGREHVSPKHGIILFGPRSIDQKERHPKFIRVGVIGSGKSTESAQRWMESCSEGVSGDEEYTDFPGFSKDRGFYSDLQFDNSWNETITQNEIRQLKNIRFRKDRFEQCIQILSDKLRLLSRKDLPLDYVVLALPDEIVEYCKVVDFKDAEKGTIHRDLRRVLKAVAMSYRFPTQILLQRTSEATPKSRNIDHKSRCAWNFFTGLYFKVGGIPWSPLNLTPGTCYVGVSFHRALGSENRNYFTSLAQAFDQHGNGLVLRGQEFHWDTEKNGNSPHLSKALARDLISAVLRQYKDEMKQQIPQRVVVHKTSKFWPEEREGFEEALSGVYMHDLLAVAPISDTRMLRDGQYPILRGSHITVGDRHFLYTTGYIPALNAFPHGHVPSPLQVYDHVGDSSIDMLLYEILVLSKMNWNSAAFAGLMPITLKFSQLVGEIMREIPESQIPLPQFKFYM